LYLFLILMFQRVHQVQGPVWYFITRWFFMVRNCMKLCLYVVHMWKCLRENKSCESMLIMPLSNDTTCKKIIWNGLNIRLQSYWKPDSLSVKSAVTRKPGINF
jgi:hypothetical protein